MTDGAQTLMDEQDREREKERRSGIATQGLAAALGLAVLAGEAWIARARRTGLVRFILTSGLAGVMGAGAGGGGAYAVLAAAGRFDGVDLILAAAVGLSGAGAGIVGALVVVERVGGRRLARRGSWEPSLGACWA